MAGSDFNKILMATLGAVLLAMMCGFIAERLVSPTQLAENAYKVDVPEKAATTPAAAPQESAPEPVAPLLAAADPQAGQKLSKACQACHSFEQGGAAKVGPNLWNIVNAPHAHMEGFAYSDAMKSLHDKQWDYEALNTFLANPKGTVPGTKMNYTGVKSAQDRANLIAWLRTLSDNPAPLP